MIKQEKRQRLIAMRECLRQVQQLLPETSSFISSQFICTHIPDTDCTAEVQQLTKNYVMRAIKPDFTFNGCIERLNLGRNFSNREMMQLRHRFIDDLCNRINSELEQLGG